MPKTWLGAAVAAALGAASAASSTSSFAAPGEIFRDCDMCPEMVVVPAGEFQMGAPDSEWGRQESETPQRIVTVNAFALGRYEVTFDQWEACAADGFCGDNPYPSDMGWGVGEQPVIGLSWVDIAGPGGFLDWLNAKTGGAASYRLPTEAEWEYAARAGSEAAFSWGGTIDPNQANYNGRFAYFGGRVGVYRHRTLPVGSFEPNAFGLSEMHGNAEEWVQDCWVGTYEGAPTDGAARGREPCEEGVLRGGSWRSPPTELRCGARKSWVRTFRKDSFGFRVARDLP